MLSRAPAAFVLALLLAACEGAPPPDIRSIDQNADTVMRVADDTAAGGDLGTAAGLYRRAADLNPQDPRPLAKLGAVLLRLHAYTEAAATYRAALAISPNPMEAELHRGYAVVLLALDQPEGALAELDQAVVKAPDDPRLYNALGVAHDLIGHHDLAQQDYRNGLRLAPENGSLRNNYALSLALSHDYPAAVATLRELAERSDASPRHRLNLALVYGLAGDDRRAAEIARTTLDEAAVANNLAYYAMLRGMDDRARANAIMGGQSHGPAVAQLAKPAPPPEHVAAVPTTPVTATTLPAAAAPRAKAPAAAPPPAPAAVAAVASAVPAAKAVDETPPWKAEQPAQKPPTPIVAAAEPDATAPAKAAPAVEPAAAAAAPTSPEASPATEAQAVPEPAPTQAPLAARAEPAAAEGFALQLGSFSLEANARHLAEHLQQKGYATIMMRRRDRDGRAWFVVRAGAYGSADAAATAARQIRDAEQVPAVVVHVHPA
jgi:Flp pilus assembly protein TadD/cell division septation protein DedD